MQIGTLFVHSFGMTSTSVFLSVSSNLSGNAIANPFEELVIDLSIYKVREIHLNVSFLRSELRIKMIMATNLMRKQSGWSVGRVAELVDDVLELFVLHVEGLLDNASFGAPSYWAWWRGLLAHSIVKGDLREPFAS